MQYMPDIGKTTAIGAYEPSPPVRIAVAVAVVAMSIVALMVISNLLFPWRDVHFLRMALFIPVEQVLGKFM